MCERIGITEAAFITNVSRQAIYVAIKYGKLKAEKEVNWKISINDLNDYRASLWSRTKSTFNGAPLVSKDKGEYLVWQIADLLNVPPQKIYYAIRTKKLKFNKKNCSYVINIEDALYYKNNYLKTA